MDLKRIATIIGVALISYFGFYITVFVYNFIAILFTTPENQYRVLAIFTAIIVTTIYALKTRVSYSPLLQPVRIRRSCGLIVYYMVPEAGVEPAPPHRLAWRGALPQHILSYSDIRKGVRPALRCRVRANAFKLGGRENLSDGASGDQPDQ